MIKKRKELNISKQIIPILKKRGVVKAGLFGSFARGEAKKNSDIDILVQFKPGKSLFDLIALEFELKERLGRKVDVGTYNSLHPLLKRKILSETIEIL